MALGSQETLDPSQSLHDLGLDSLFAVQLRNRLQADWQIVVPVASIIAGPSVAQLAGQILEQLEVTPSPGPVEIERNSPAENWNVDLAHLSDDDIDLVLSELLAATENES